jgi:hypothetical protein
MAAGVEFFATPEDEQLFLDYILSSDTVRLFPWVAMDVEHPLIWDRQQLPAPATPRERYGIVDYALGAIHFVNQRPTDCGPGRATAFALNLLNWNRVSPSPGQGIVDWNRTAALFWQRGAFTAEGALDRSNIGSQADAMDDVSPDYRRWVNRVMSWVRRKGIKVWQDGKRTPEAADLDIDIPHLSPVFALPGAMKFFQAGGADARYGKDRRDI